MYCYCFFSPSFCSFVKTAKVESSYAEMIAELEGLRKLGESVDVEWWKKVVVNNTDVASSCPEVVEMLLNEVVNPGLKFGDGNESQLLLDFLVEKMWEVGFVCGIVDDYALKYCC